MTLASFSTMWAQQDRFADLGRFRDLVAGFGYDAIEVSHSTGAAGLKQLLARGPLPVSSLHAPVPHHVLADGRRNAEANLASTDAAETRIALDETILTIDHAAEAGLPYVVVHLGGVGQDRCDEERALRRLFESGVTSGTQWDAARDRLRLARDSAIAEHLEVARRSLAVLVGHASGRGVAIGVESRLNYHEIPHPDEAADLLAPYSNEEAGFWYDVGHCEVQSRLGMIEHAWWRSAIGNRIIGAHLHDVRGIVDHRAPGNGTLDWSLVADTLPAGALRVLEIDQHEPDEGVAGAIDFLQQRGVLGAGGARALT